MQFQSFRNTDPPRLAEFWAMHTPTCGLASTVTPTILETYVFSKPYFHRDDFIIAEEDRKIRGFVHVGFGPNEERTDVCTELATTCMLQVARDADFHSIARPLLERAEARMKQRGAKVMYAGSVAPLNPFYVGLTGDCEPPGIRASETQLIDLLESSGYREIDRAVILHQNLADFRVPIDRQLVQVKRKMRVEMDPAPHPDDWWDACTHPPHDPTRFEIAPKHGGPAFGSIRFWFLEWYSQTRGRMTVGLNRLNVDPEHRNQGMATFLCVEALRHLQMHGVQQIETQTMIHNQAARRLYTRLGFEEKNQSIVFRKDAT